MCCKLALDVGRGASPALMKGWVIDRNLRLQVITKAGEFSETQLVINGCKEERRQSAHLSFLTGGGRAIGDGDGDGSSSELGYSTRVDILFVLLDVQVDQILVVIDGLCRGICAWE